MPLASLFLLIFIDPVVSEAISKTKDKKNAVHTVPKIVDLAIFRKYCEICKPALYLCH